MYIAPSIAPCTSIWTFAANATIEDHIASDVAGIPVSYYSSNGSKERKGSR